MAGAGGIPPAGLAVSLPVNQTFGLQPGLTYVAQVVADGQGLALEVQGAKIPVPMPLQAAPGDAIRIQFTHTPDGPQLRIVPGQPPTRADAAPQSVTPHVPSATAKAHDVAAARVPAANASTPGAPAAQVLSLLNQFRAPEAAAPLIPKSLPPNAEAVRQLLALFMKDDALGRDVTQLAAVVRSAVNAGAVSNPVATAATGGLVTAASPAGVDLIDVIRRWHEHSVRSTEARILRAINGATAQTPPRAPATAQAFAQPDSSTSAARTGAQAPASAQPPPAPSQPDQAGHQAAPPRSGPLPEAPAPNAPQNAARPAPNLASVLASDVREHLARLMSDEGFQRHLRASGQADAFRETAGRVLQRLTGAQLQNVHGLDLPYLFIEVPFDPSSQIARAQIHIFGEGQGRNKRFGSGHSAIAFDLETPALGPVWIHLSLFQHNCVCTLQATTPESVALIDRHRHELAEALEAAGFSNAVVRSSAWDGDRLAAAARLFQPFSALDVHA